MPAAARPLRMKVLASRARVAVVGIASCVAMAAAGCGGGAASQRDATPPSTSANASGSGSGSVLAEPCPVVAGASESVHLKPLRPGAPMGAVIPDHWTIDREESVDGVHAVVMMWPGNALGLVVTPDDARRCVLGTWAIAFGGNGMTLTDWRMARDPHDGQVHMHMAFYGTYHIPEGADPEEPGTAELRSDGHAAELVKTTGYAAFE
jgi:hypothetical protein